MPVRVDYSITEAGESLVPILDEFRDWMVAYEPHLYYKR
jgi:DNA-binding HxlR family transcriptional regulator